jgi:hypothetical protein
MLLQGYRSILFRNHERSSMMIMVFKTNVPNKISAEYIINNLLKEYPGYIISIDVGDCDKVLRVEGMDFRMEDIINRLQRLGFACEELP